MIYVPDTVVCALFPEAGTDGCAFFLNDGSFVGDGLRGAYVADELLDCGVAGTSVTPDTAGWLAGDTLAQM